MDTAEVVTSFIQFLFHACNVPGVLLKAEAMK